MLILQVTVTSFLKLCQYTLGHIVLKSLFHPLLLLLGQLCLSQQQGSQETPPHASQLHHSGLQSSSQHVNNRSPNCRIQCIKAQLIWYHSGSFVSRRLTGKKRTHSEAIYNENIYGTVTCTEVNEVQTKCKNTKSAYYLRLSSSCVTTAKGSAFLQLSRHFVISQLWGSCTVQTVCETHQI